MILDLCNANLLEGHYPSENFETVLPLNWCCTLQEQYQEAGHQSREPSLGRHSTAEGTSQLYTIV